MRGPRSYFNFLLEIGEDQKKVFVVRDDAPQFLRGPPFSPKPKASACSAYRPYT